MVRKQIFLLWFFLALGLAGCTVAIPQVSSLTTLSSFSNKSTSPFLQDNVGGAIYISGECLPQVTSFEFRLNDNPIWSPVPPTSPTPASQEYVVGSPDYDVDCSDGTYNFYLFKSTAMGNFTLNGLSAGAADPYQVEFRVVGVSDVPSIVFKRPNPAALVIQTNYYQYSGHLETDRFFNFNVRLLDANGRQTRAYASTAMSLNAFDLNRSVASSGVFYKNDCATVASAADLIFNPGDDELQFCFKAQGATPGNTVRIESASNGLISGVFDLPIINQNSALTLLQAYNVNEDLPPVFLKDVDYSITISNIPLYSSGSRFFSSFNGGLTIDAQDPNVSFVRSGSDTECPSTAQASSMTCTTTAIGKSIVMRINGSYSQSRINLSVGTAPGITSCGSNCLIYDTGNSYPVTEWYGSSFSAPVVSGSTNFDQPYLSLDNPIMQLDACSTGHIALANVDGNVIPGINKTLNIGSTGSVIEFFYDGTCSTTQGYSKTFTFYSGSYMQRFNYKLRSFPSNGQAIFTIVDELATNWTKPFYVKNGN